MGEDYKKVLEMSNEALNKLLNKASNKRQDIHGGRSERQQEISIPLSYAQNRLWFMNQLVPESTAYNITKCYIMEGELNEHAFLEAFQRIYDRHDCLRTEFIVNMDTPFQKVTNGNKLELERLDYRGFSDEMQKDRIENEIIKEQATAFDLTKAPLLRLKLIRIDDNKYIFIFVIHHIIYDGWSDNILLFEFSQFYNHLCSGENPNMEELPAQYADYAMWLLEKEQLNKLDKEEPYWKEKVKEIIMMNLPVKSNYNMNYSFTSDEYFVEIDSEVLTQLKQIGTENNGTLYMVLLSALYVLLFKYTGQSNISIGTTIANRQEKRFEKLIGLFVNTLLICQKVNYKENFLYLLNEIRDNLIETYSYQDYPYEKIVELCKLQMEGMQQNIVQVYFDVQDFQFDKIDLNHMTVSQIKIKDSTSKYNLYINAVQKENTVTVEFHYNCQLYDKETIVSMANNYINIIKEIVSHPTKSIESISMLQTEEYEKITKDWNHTRECFENENLCLHQLFEIQAEKTPDAIALTYKNQNVTYREMAENVHRVANALIVKKVKCEQAIAVLMDRSLEMVYTIYGVLEAGGFYIPIDPTYPKERIKHMLEDSKAEILIIDEANYNIVKDIHVNDLVVFEKDITTNYNVLSPKVQINNQNLAYMIYTSGSTGAPKGVMISHRSIVNRLLWMQKKFQLTKEDRVLQKTPYSFDVSVWELFLPLLVGSRLVIAEKNGHKDSRYLCELIQKESVTTIHFVPSMLAVFLEDKFVKNCTSLVNVICSGEALSYELKEKFYKTCCGELYNLYGPTEAAVDVSYWNCKDNSIQYTVPIGYPISNIQLYVLNDNLDVVPVGVKGELYIGGVGLARGYFNRPKLTADKFIPNPFSSDYSSRLYRTDDLARYLPNGSIEYLGRCDNQVKIRGLRIELGEIEAQILKSENVREAVVQVENFGDLDKRLIAYLVCNEEVDVTSLKARLREKLPDYMIPYQFVELEKMPLSLNGKLDRKMLSNVKRKNRKSESGKIDHVKKGIQMELIQIWKDILNVDQISSNDNFFDLGGHSLLLTKVQKKIENKLHIDIKLIDLMEHPTLKDLANFIDPNHESSAQVKKNQDHYEKEPLAIIGMSCNFPGADNIEDFWNQLIDDREGITFFTDQELIDAGVDKEEIACENYVKASGVVSHYDSFDAAYFNISKRDLMLMDPQQRLFLEAAAESLEDAGYGAYQKSQNIGVFSATGANKYLLNLQVNSDCIGKDELFQIMLLNRNDFSSTRVSYKLNLTGPSMDIQSACSSSMVAIATACDNLNNHRCDMAIAGGSSISVPHKIGYFYEEGMILSKDGHCKPFNYDSTGTTPGNGVGVIVIKRLSDAIKDHDHIYSVIKGIGINNDGSNKIGYTAPSVQLQREAIQNALEEANVEKNSIAYIETHGTATSLGDKVEITALTKALAGDDDKDKEHKIPIGSVKSNIGHLDVAAGVAGIIKTSLMLKNEMLVPTVHFVRPNKTLELEKTPFYVNTETKRWVNHQYPLRAGVSSFGMGGTNVHIVLEEGPQLEKTYYHNKGHLIVLSAKTEKALQELMQSMVKYLSKHTQINLGDVAYTLQTGRYFHEHRIMFVAKTMQEAIERLQKQNMKQLHYVKQDREMPSVCFMFSGIGDHYGKMGEALYSKELVFREEMDRCSKLIQEYLENDIREWLFDEKNKEVINNPLYTHAVLFSIEYSLAKLLMSWGIKPSGMIGYSLGEYVAATIAGVISVEDALKMITTRAKLIVNLPKGAMLAVIAKKEKIESLLFDDCYVSIENAPELNIVSGSVENIELLKKKLDQLEISYGNINADRAYHCQLMEPIKEKYTTLLNQVEYNEPKIPYISNTTGEWIKKEEASSAEYWANQSCKAVKFAQGIRTIITEKDAMIVEIGPGQLLKSIVTQNMVGQRTNAKIITTLQSNKNMKMDEELYLLQAVGQMWEYDVPIQWDKIHQSDITGRVSLPTYPFQRERYWIGDKILMHTQSNSTMSKVPTESIQRVVEESNKDEGSKDTNRNDVFAQLEQIYKEIFGQKCINAEMNFFELGGESLLALRILSIIKKRFNVKLQLKDIFEATNITMLASKIESLIHIHKDTESDMIQRADHFNQEIPLSYRQESLWMLWQFYKDNTAYVQTSLLNFHHEIDVSKMESSINKVIERHEILRTNFLKHNGVGYQKIHTSRIFQLDYVSVQQKKDNESDECFIQRIAKEEANQPFDIERDLLIRGIYIQMNQHKCAIVLSVHHIIVDGQSIGNLLNEIMTIYWAKDYCLPKLSIQYRDYVIWQRNYFTDDRIRERMEFLRPIFKNVKKLNLSDDYVKNDDINGSCEYFNYHFTEQTYQGLHDVCVKNETTLFTVLCSAFSILLSNRTRQNSISFLTTVSGHDHEQLKDMIGYFANTILISMNINRTNRIQENIENIRSVLADALQYKDIPYEMVLREMHKVPNWSENQLPNILFLLLKHNKKLDFTNGETVEVEEIYNGNAKFDISFIMSESEDGMEADIEYRSDLYNRETMESMVKEFATILDEINAHSDLRIDDIELTSKENPDSRSNHPNIQGGFNFDMK